MVQRSVVTLAVLTMLSPFAPLTSGSALAQSAQPVPPEFPLDGHALSVTGSYGCARTRDGHAACWGHAPDGEHPVPATVPGLADLAGVATATGRVLAWTRTGEVWQWTGEPATRMPLTEVVEIAASEDATCARRRDDGVACWLAGAAPANAFTGAAQIAVAGYHACARAGDDVSCWTIGADPAKSAIVTRAHGAIAIAGADRGTRGSVIAVVLPRGKIVAWAYAWAPPAVGAGAITALPRSCPSHRHHRGLRRRPRHLRARRERDVLGRRREADRSPPHRAHRRARDHRRQHARLRGHAGPQRALLGQPRGHRRWQAVARDRAG